MIFVRRTFGVPDWREWAGKLAGGDFQITVLYPTRFMHIGQIGNPTYAVELCRAYNDYLYDKFLTHDRRFRGMALLPLQDPAAAVKELRRAVHKDAMVGGILPADGLQLPLGHRQYWPVYREADKLGCVLSVHSCKSLRQRPLSRAQRSRDLDPCDPADATTPSAFTGCSLTGGVQTVQSLCSVQPLRSV